MLDHDAAECAVGMFEADGCKWVLTETKLLE
jgi:hypothetical protein